MNLRDRRNNARAHKINARLEEMETRMKKTDRRATADPPFWIEMIDPGPGDGRPGNHCRLGASTEQSLDETIRAKLLRGWKICNVCNQQE